MTTFNSLIKSFEKNATTLDHSAGSAAKSLARAKLSAHAMAVSHLKLIELHHGNLLDHVNQMGFKGRDCVNQMLSKKFAPLTRIGEHWRELITAVRAGMTRDDFLKTSASAWLSAQERKEAKKKADLQIQQGEPEAEAPIEERLEYWKTLAKRRDADARRLERRVAMLENQIERLHETIRPNNQAAANG